LRSLHPQADNVVFFSGLSVVAGEKNCRPWERREVNSAPAGEEMPSVPEQSVAHQLPSVGTHVVESLPTTVDSPQSRQQRMVREISFLRLPGPF